MAATCPTTRTFGWWRSRAPSKNQRKITTNHLQPIIDTLYQYALKSSRSAKREVKRRIMIRFCENPPTRHKVPSAHSWPHKKFPESNRAGFVGIRADQFPSLS